MYLWMCMGALNRSVNVCVCECMGMCCVCAWGALNRRI